MASLAHLTCASSTIEEVRDVIENLKETGLKTFLRFGEISRKACRSRTEIVLDMHMS